MAVALLAGLFPATVIHADETRVWQEGDVMLSERSRMLSSIGWKLVSLNASRIDAWELKPKAQAALLPWLDAAATYKLMRSPHAGRGWATAHGLELDLSPHWRMGNGLGIRLTQRLGVMVPPAGATSYRYHWIPKVDWPAQWLPAAVSIDSSFEAIRDIQRSQWVETKWTPLRWKFAAGDGHAWSLAYLLNHKRIRPDGRWQHEHVVVVALLFDLRSA